MELFDFSLLELDFEFFEWEEFFLVVKVVFLCIVLDLVDRFLMFEVIFMLEGCCVGLEMIILLFGLMLYVLFV